MELATTDSPTTARGGFLSSVLAENPAKRAVETAWLAYTPVWGAVSGIIMAGGFAERWGDLPLMIFGVTMMVGALLAPYANMPAEERAKPFLERSATKMSAVVVLLSYGLNYTQTPFFWEVLHMHYGFRTTWNIDSNPFFLYCLTVAYFATYSVLCTFAFRAIQRGLANAPAAARWTGYALAPFAMAFLETVLNQNPFTTRLFCYDDNAFMLTFGTFAYGVAFVFAMPIWATTDEDASKPSKLLPVMAITLGALYADLLVLDTLQATVAPRLTHVEPGTRGLRDYEGSCLVPPES